jgi:S1-C subfamily serine protease
MRVALVTAIAAASVAFSGIAARPAEESTLLPQSIADVVAKARPALVNVRVKGIVKPAAGQAAFKEPHMTEFVGSGVIIDPSGSFSRTTTLSITHMNSVCC